MKSQADTITPPLPQPPIGSVRVRGAREIGGSLLGIGAETIDRDFVDFSEIKDHLEPLGAKTVRLQAGWAKCEPQPGHYDFAWLDEIVDGVIDAGMEPWLQTSYGNPIYEGGGGSSLHGGLPTSVLSFDAWDRWVSALARRYAGRVTQWEIWNEPDLLKDNPAIEYARLYIRTARIIRAQIPAAKLTGQLAAPGRTEFARTFLQYLDDQNALELVDDISFHGYLANPDVVYDEIEGYGRGASVPPLMRTVREFSTTITIRQGEQGCPSTETTGALKEHKWTELMQAKWMLRRMLTDIGHAVPTSYFQIADMNYRNTHKNPWYGMNTKGLMRMNPELKFVYRKPSYRAFQALASIFDSTLEPITELRWRATADQPLRVYGFSQEHSRYSAIVYWRTGDAPADQHQLDEVGLDLDPVRIENPVLVDLLTGTVHSLSDTSVAENRRSGTAASFRRLPLYDSPVVIADAACVPIESNVEQT